ncbi:hypothetical protein jhhlp_004687 [Lomentospora prolificans]|uniref:RNA polymerase II elongator complex subunit n=1 Tax=Lomentospora prolificans TaxID=41688 RepID=A0A2N3NCH7_9PEZI|nr:hypothetical protein jhhlp_004687 [Lomentospora prolificans]
MPLIIISGLPTSGKSTRAKQLESYLRSRISGDENGARDAAPKYRVHLISDDSLSISRSVYDLSSVPAHARSANASEKNARAALYGAVNRVLSDKDIVILDGLNYIKGWRYQLYCDAKAARTPSVVLQIGCDPEKAKSVNNERLKRNMERDTSSSDTPESEDLPEAYAPANWENLVFRYEEPNPMTRWDSPLFALVWDDDEERTKQVFDQLWDAIAGEGRKMVKPNQATVQRGRDASADYLYVLDRETQEIIRTVLENQGEDGGAAVKIARSSGGSDRDDALVVELPGEKVGFPQLQRMRRAFIGLTRGGIGLEGVVNLGPDRIRESFVGYLNDTFEREG